MTGIEGHSPYCPDRYAAEGEAGSCTCPPAAADGPKTTLARLRRLSQAATPGPWISLNGSIGSEADEQLVADAMREHPAGRDEADADFIAAAVNYVRATIGGGL